MHVVGTDGNDSWDDADSADHGRSGVDGISLPTFPVTGADLPVPAYFGDDGISLAKYVFADASYHLFGN